MKFTFLVPCRCGEKLPVTVTGTQFPNDAQCHKCHSTIWLVKPLGNIAGKAIHARASAELEKGDWTLAIVLSAMAVECDLAYLFMKWSRIDLMSERMPTDADEEKWEAQWRDNARTVAARFDRVSGLLTGEPFDAFLSHNAGLLEPVHIRRPPSKTTDSPKNFFITELFHKRNRIVHFGEIDFRRTDAEMGITLSITLSKILAEMDAQRFRALQAEHS